MRRTHRARPLLPPLLAAVLLVACLGLDPDLGVSLDWDVVAEGELEQSADARGGRGSIIVLGQIPTSLPCNPLAADIRRSGATVHLTVKVIEEQNFCLGNPSTYRYVANLLNVKRGSHTLVVEHRFENADRPAQIVFEGSVTVT